MGKKRFGRGYQSKLSKSQLENFTGFLQAVGVMHALDIIQVALLLNPKASVLLRSGLIYAKNYQYEIIEDYSIHAIESYLGSHSITASWLIWQVTY